MSKDVKRPAPAALRQTRVARTEQQLVAAAEALFLARGYVATTLTDVAAQAGLAPRTVYVRFGTKAALFSRVVDQALAGATASHADGVATLRDALHAPTLKQRTAALVEVSVQVGEQVGPLFEVAAQAEGLEPELAQSAQAGRRALSQVCQRFWRQAVADGLVHAGLGVRTAAMTTDALICADTVVHLRRLGSWSPAQYRVMLTQALADLAQRTS